MVCLCSGFLTVALKSISYPSLSLFWITGDNIWYFLGALAHWTLGRLTNEKSKWTTGRQKEGKLQSDSSLTEGFPQNVFIHCFQLPLPQSYHSSNFVSGNVTSSCCTSSTWGDSGFLFLEYHERYISMYLSWNPVKQFWVRLAQFFTHCLSHHSCHSFILSCFPSLSPTSSFNLFSLAKDRGWF